MSRHQPRRAHFGDDYTLRPNIIRRRVNYMAAWATANEEA